MPARFDLRIHAFVLMGNHYHLQIETLKPNLILDCGPEVDCLFCSNG